MKIFALFRIRFFLTLEQVEVLAEAYLLSNFRYCVLVWMFCGKCSNNLIMKTHYRCLRAIHNTQTKRYRDLLRINGNIDTHWQNIQILMTDIFKCLNKISPPFAWDYYIQRSNHYKLRREHLLNLISAGRRPMDSTRLLSKVKSYGTTFQITLRKQSLWQSSKCTCCTCS